MTQEEYETTLQDADVMVSNCIHAQHLIWNILEMPIMLRICFLRGISSRYFSLRTRRHLKK